MDEDIKPLHPSGGDSLCLHPSDLKFFVNRLNREEWEEQGDNVSERVRSSDESAKNERCSRFGRD